MTFVLSLIILIGLEGCCGGTKQLMLTLRAGGLKASGCAARLETQQRVHLSAEVQWGAGRCATLPHTQMSANTCRCVALGEKVKPAMSEAGSAAADHS